jgi:hypothetical protein
MNGNGLSSADVQELMQEGYSMSDINDALREVEQEELQKGYNIQQNRVDPRTYAQNSPFGQGSQDNLIKWQLELDNILERAEHILRGDRLVFESGHEIWKKNPDRRMNILNEYGVQEVMRILSAYLNRNLILSDFDSETINFKMLDFGRELNDLFFMKYEEMGLNVDFEEAFQIMYDTDENIIYSEEQGIQIPVMNQDGTLTEMLLSQQQVQEIDTYRIELALEKRKNYPMLVRELVDMVHASFRRAYLGGERRSLREARQISQVENLNQMQNGMMMPPQMSAKRSIFNPMRYIDSKWKR